MRIFYDGIEIDVLDTRRAACSTSRPSISGRSSILPSSGAPSELRVYMRTWRVDNTDPYTRIDVATGNEDTNLYRGFYGKRFDNGGVLQLAGQQYGVTSSRLRAEAATRSRFWVGSESRGNRGVSTRS